MAKPNSRQELVDYCLRALGAPVIEINLDDDQIGDRLDDAIQYYQEYHGDATIRRYRKHQVTSADINNEYIDIPETYVHIARVLPFRSGQGAKAAEFNIDYQIGYVDKGANQFYWINYYSNKDALSKLQEIWLSDREASENIKNEETRTEVI